MKGFYVMDFATPNGFRDFMPKEARRRERLNCQIQSLFEERGYAPIETPTLEYMRVMDQGGHVPGNPIKLFDAAGDLLAMRPDVTLQIARMCATRLADQEGPFRFRYSQRVFREAVGQTAENRESTQIGLECIGEEGAAADAELIGLMVEALTLCGLRDFTVSLGTVRVLDDLLNGATDDAQWKAQVRDAFHESNFVALDELCAREDIPAAYADAIRQLPRLRGGAEAIEAVRALVGPLGCAFGLNALATTFSALQERGLADCLLVDFSVISSFDYYTGVLFEVYSPELGTPLGSGGRYDNVLAAYGKPRPAAGFAFYLERVMSAVERQNQREGERPLRIAVPKGSLNGDAIACLQAAGLDTTGLENPGRLLMIKNPGVEFIIVRAQDAPAFVALGGADCGICGKDSLVEANLDVVELVDLQFGACRFVVAEPEGATEQVEDRYWRLGSIRVATKYPRITKAYYDKLGQQVEIVQLHGNIELGPLIGLSERIVDITATGTTLRENNLRIVDDVLASTARFFANTCAFRTDERISKLAEAMAQNVKER
ncbi:MAG: ATP phosphoribosyltransferase regulatory subunit [Eggerthellales bacterium]|nr:ATP phosphoribosyltransferase regulatory subunit [Eggerthellales bacterium]